MSKRQLLLCDMADFKSLKFLQVNMSALVGFPEMEKTVPSKPGIPVNSDNVRLVDTLPANLITLSILSCDWYVDQYVHDLASKHEKTLPHLTSIDLYYGAADPEHNTFSFDSGDKYGKVKMSLAHAVSKPDVRDKKEHLQKVFRDVRKSLGFGQIS